MGGPDVLHVPNRDADGDCELGYGLLERGGEPHPANQVPSEHFALVVRVAESFDLFWVADRCGAVAAKISLPDGVLSAVRPALAGVVGRERDVVLGGSRIFVEATAVFLCSLHRFSQQHATRLHHREIGSQNGQPDRRHVFLYVLRLRDNGIVLYRIRR